MISSNTCPDCGSTETEGNSYEWENDNIDWEMDCLVCHASWYIRHQYIGTVRSPFQRDVDQLPTKDDQ